MLFAKEHRFKIENLILTLILTASSLFIIGYLLSIFLIDNYPICVFWPLLLFLTFPIAVLILEICTFISVNFSIIKRLRIALSAITFFYIPAYGLIFLAIFLNAIYRAQEHIDVGWDCIIGIILFVGLFAISIVVFIRNILLSVIHYNLENDNINYIKMSEQLEGITTPKLNELILEEEFILSNLKENKKVLTNKDSSKKEKRAAISTAINNEKALKLNQEAINLEKVNFE